MLDGIKAVFFDAVGTLLHPEPAAAVVYADAARRFGSSLSPAVVARRFALAFAREDELDRAGGLRTGEERGGGRWGPGSSVRRWAGASRRRSSSPGCAGWPACGPRRCSTSATTRITTTAARRRRGCAPSCLTRVGSTPRCRTA